MKKTNIRRVVDDTRASETIDATPASRTKINELPTSELQQPSISIPIPTFDRRQSWSLNAKIRGGATGRDNTHESAAPTHKKSLSPLV